MELRTPATDPENMRSRDSKLTDDKDKKGCGTQFIIKKIAFGVMELPRSRRWKMTGMVPGPHTKSLSVHGIDLLCEIVDFIPPKIRKRVPIRTDPDPDGVATIQTVENDRHGARTSHKKLQCARI